MEKTSFEQIKEEFLALHDIGYAPNGGALIGLEKAEDMFGEVWVKRELSLEEVLSIVLPYHAHWGNPDPEGILLVPPAGATVGETVEKLFESPVFAQSNPTCWQSMNLSAKTNSPVYLSIGPIDNEDYGMQDARPESTLFHIDGLHRLLFWGLQCKYEPKNYADNPVVAYIAGE